MFKDMKNNPKSKNIKFGVFCNLNVGTLRNAPDIKTAILNLTKREKEFWSHIMWFNDKGQTMQITRKVKKQIASYYVLTLTL